MSMLPGFDVSTSLRRKEIKVDNIEDMPLPFD